MGSGVGSGVGVGQWVRVQWMRVQWVWVQWVWVQWVWKISAEGEGQKMDRAPP